MLSSFTINMWAVSALCFVALVNSVSGFLFNRQVCYGVLGCFNTDSPFRSTARPITLLPQSPAEVNTVFRLFTRNNPDKASEDILSYEKPEEIATSDFSSTRQTKFIVHGFLQQGVHDPKRPWFMTMVKELLRNGDFNVIAVDWSGGNQFPYTQATANTRLVGAQLAQMILTLQKKTGLGLSDIHIIGHSLGAHVSGYAGQRVPGIARITGIDPADPYFTNTDARVRLDPTDANFVDVIHTDASSLLELGLGSAQAMGHADFYPNGGEAQPECSKTVGKVAGGIFNLLQLNSMGAELAFSCNHIAGIFYFIDSINSPCKFRGYTCNDYETFKTGKCLNCEGNWRCSNMGLHAHTSSRGVYYLETSGHAPYCRNHYSVSVKTAPTAAVSKGTLEASVQGSKAISKAQHIIEESTRLPANTEFSRLISTPADLGTPQNLILKFKKQSGLLTGWIYPDGVDFSGVSVQHGESQLTFRSCLKSVKNTKHDIEEIFSLTTNRCI